MTIFTNDITFTDTSPNKPVSTLGKNLISSTTESAARTAIAAQEQFTFGTWTPAYSMNTSGSVQALTAQGRFLLIPPDFVWVWLVLSSSSLNSPVGGVSITLPFPCLEATPVTIRAQSWGSTITYLQGVAASSSATRAFITLFKNNHGQNFAGVASSDLSSVSNGNFINATLLYQRDI